MPKKSANEHEKRMDRLRRAMKRAEIDILLVFTETNRLYLTGFHSTAGVLIVPADGEAWFLTDFRYMEMARKAITVAKVRESKSIVQTALEHIKKKGWKRVGYEGSIPASGFHGLRDALPDEVGLIESEGLILDLRMIKSRGEQAALRRAVRLGDEVWRRTVEEVEPGMTEWDVRRILRGWVDRLDASRESFDCIVSAGNNASKPHAKVTARVLRRGQPLLIDMGVVLDGYCSDLTRTVFLGNYSAKMREVYDIVLEAQLRAIDAVRAGVRCCDVDAVARKYIAKHGYDGKFGHNLGHGVGLDIHESPRLGPGNETELKPGMVVTIEPGIYLPGIGGVRIEDMVIVRGDECKNLTQSPKDLTILD